MAELRYTDTNSGDDSGGRAFGLEGNLYLPVVLAVIGAVGLLALLALVLHLPYLMAGLVAGLPLTGVLTWVVLLRQGKPPGYDRDWVQARLGDRHFTRSAKAQGGLT